MGIKSAYQIVIDRERKREMIVVEVESFSKKMEIMKAKNKIRGSQVYIDNDLTKNERGIQKEIREIAKEERDKGKTVRTGYQKIIINGKEFRWDSKIKGVAEVKTKN